MQLRAIVGLVSVALAFSAVCTTYANDCGDEGWAGPHGAPPPDAVLLRPQPTIVPLRIVDDAYVRSSVSAVYVGQVVGNQRPEIVVAWWATDNVDKLRSLRRVTVLRATGDGYSVHQEIDLYQPDPNNISKSIFRQGTSHLVAGDYDGDGDVDLAALPVLGDEIWFLENVSGTFSPILKFFYGWNTAGGQSPTEAAAADLDGDGRDELVYIVDPATYADNRRIHIWRTTSTLAAIERAPWEGFFGSMPNVAWTYGLAIADFDGDGMLDIGFTGVELPSGTPLFLVWYNLDPVSGFFDVASQQVSAMFSDVVALPAHAGGCPPGVLFADIDGQRIEHWEHTCGPVPGFAYVGSSTGYSGSGGVGMACLLRDIDGDNDADLVVKQRDGLPADTDQIQVSLREGDTWQLVSPCPVDTAGFADMPTDTLRRFHNFDVADVQGSTLPEIVAGFAGRELDPTRAAPPGGDECAIEVVIWPNGCMGDVNRDGYTDQEDLAALNASYLYCESAVPDLVRGGGQEAAQGFNPDADLNKDGCVTASDRTLLVHDFGCSCWEKPYFPGDCNCDSQVDFADINPFTLAIDGEGLYYQWFPRCNWYNADMNADGLVDFDDIALFVNAVGGFGKPDVD